MKLQWPAIESRLGYFLHITLSSPCLLSLSSSHDHYYYCYYYHNSEMVGSFIYFNTHTHKYIYNHICSYDYFFHNAFFNSFNIEHWGSVQCALWASGIRNHETETMHMASLTLFVFPNCDSAALRASCILHYWSVL